MKERKINAAGRQKRKPVWPWLAVLLVIAAGGAGWYFLGSSSPFKQPIPTTGTENYTTPVRRGDISISASGSGTLTAGQTIDLSFSTRGTVTQLNVQAGDMVKTGEVLAQLGSGQTLQANLASAQLNLLQAQKTLADLQNNNSVSLAQAYQNWVKAQSDYNTTLTTNQRTAYARCSDQVNVKYKTALDNAATKLNKFTQEAYGSDNWVTAKSAYDTALANYNYCIGYSADEKSNANASLTAAKANLQQTEATYNTLKAASGIDPTQLALNEAKVQQAQTQLDKAKSDLGGITLTAPIDGKVIYVAASQGSVVGTSKFITIADVSQPVVQISVDETDLGKLTPGTSAQVVFDALPDQTFSGKVTAVNPQLVTSGQTHVAQGTVALDDTAAKALQNLPLGLSASVDVIQKQAKNTLLVPLQALKNLGDNQYAVFVVKNGDLSLTPVQVGIEDSTHAQILSGLNDGDVVSTGTTQVK